jgi:hypothetical protein
LVLTSRQRIFAPASAHLDQLLRTSPTTGRRPSTSSGPTEVSRVLTAPFPSNIFSTPVKPPPRFLMTSECLPAAQPHDPIVNTTPLRMKLSYASILWSRPLVMILYPLSRAPGGSGLKSYVPFAISIPGGELMYNRHSQAAGMERCGILVTIFDGY